MNGRPQLKMLLPKHRSPARSTALLLFVVFAGFPVAAQQSRITRAIDLAQRTRLSGHIHPKAVAANDLGPVDPSLAMNYVTITFSQSAAQQADLQQLLQAQQTPTSSQYHQWLTPEEYAQRFGLSAEDLSKVTAWAAGQGLSIAGIGRGRNWIAVNGSAAQIENAFATSIHGYTVDGETHFANSTEPSLPAALANVTKSIRGLHDFRSKPAKRLMNPKYTSAKGNHYLAPNDFSTIYDLQPLYNSGMNGSGQKIVIVGQTRINLSDIHQFRTNYNLPSNDPQTLLVPGSQDPGISTNDLPEADLDLEWSGAVARNASITFVYAYDVMQAVQYAIDQNLAPVVSSSYGSCELETPSSDALTYRSWAEQANVQGITWFAASGDSGAADCDDSQHMGLAVDLPASIPEVTGVGGTEFAEGTGIFWNSTTDANGASALGVIPEKGWNDSAADGSPAATGGGASVLFSRPAWQTGPGVPSDNARHVPDVSFSASADHDGYLVYTGGSLQVYGGTSVPAPAFAGVGALLNQYLTSTGAQTSAGLGNINPKLYTLAQTTSGVFRDITLGDNIVTVACSKRVTTCSAVAVGYTAGSGYDSVTGLGSVDAFQLLTSWSSGGTIITNSSPVSLALMSNLTSLTTQDSLFVTATVSSNDGSTPTGNVSFSAGTVPLGSVRLVGSAGTATATLVVQGAQLPLGATAVMASYSPASSNSLTSTVNLTVLATGSISGASPAISGTTNAASFGQHYAPGMILSLFGSQLAPAAQSAASVPLPVSMNGVAMTINGVSAPLFYVSSTQLNVQIPYEITPGTSATVTVNNNGQVASSSLVVASAAPGIFGDQNGFVVPSASAARGQITTLYLTGIGNVSPAIATGAAPSLSVALANLPAPAQGAVVTVAGISASVQFLGIPYGLVGVAQINFTVPSNVPLGTQPVIVTVGGVSSPVAYLTVGN